MITSKFFSEGEFQKCSPPCSLQDMDQDFMNFMDALRIEAGIPLKINSAYRSKEHEKKQGRSGDSAHTERKAIDIAAINSNTRYKILKAAFKLGCKRIGISFKGNFIHVDRSTILPQDVCWDY